MSRLDDRQRAEVALLALVWSLVGLSRACDEKRRRQQRKHLTRLVRRARIRNVN